MFAIKSERKSYENEVSEDNMRVTRGVDSLVLVSYFFLCRPFLTSLSPSYFFST